MRLTAMERAFELARAGQKLTLTQMADVLGREGYSLIERRQLSGPSLAKQLRGISAEARRVRSGVSA